MRYTFCGLIAALVATVILAFVLTAPAGHADSTNLLANGGFEAGSTGWTADSWGTNDATLSLVPDAHSGSTGARVTMTSYTDGDAKWAPDPTGVTPGDSYTYTDWSTSTGQTHLWAQFLAPDGSVSYSYLHAVAASATWTPVAADIQIPQNVSAVRVFHVLAGVGTLTIDDAALTADAVCAPSSVNGLTNGDFEDACPSSSDGVPAGWTGESGQGNAAFADSADAVSGAHAVTITDDVDGQEAGITTSIAGPRAGQRYSLAFSQSGTTYVYAYVAIGHSDGTTSYLSLMSAPATRGVWSRYTDAFVTPSDTTSLDLTLATSGIGHVTLDAVTLTAAANQIPATFRAPMVSITFDDGSNSAITGALPVMSRNGMRGTYYLNGSTLNTSGFLTSAQVRLLAAAGNEIGSHLYHHTDMTLLDDATLRSELTGNVTALQRVVGTSVPINAFASPYGAYTSGELDTVMRTATSHRTTDGRLNTKANLNPRLIHAVPVTPAMTAADIAALVRQAQVGKAWLVLVYHAISAGAGQRTGEQGYTVPVGRFGDEIAAIKKSGVAVLPVTSALTTLQTQ